VATGNELWIYSKWQKTSIYASWPAKVPPMVRNTIGTQKIMIMVFVGVERLMSVDTLGLNDAFTQYHFTPIALYDLKNYAHNLLRPKQPAELAVHIDNSSRHKAEKVINKMRRNHMIRLGHAPYSPDLNPRDVWLFGVLKNQMKENELRNADEVDDLFAIDGVM
jgi:hypothetical protein